MGFIHDERMLVIQYKNYAPMLRSSLEYIPTFIQQCEVPKISKLVYNSNNYGLWYLQL